jgi:hypothetical protein
MMTRQTLRAFCRENVDAPTDKQGRLLSNFEMSIAELREDLADINDFDTVEAR